MSADGAGGGGGGDKGGAGGAGGMIAYTNWTIAGGTNPTDNYTITIGNGGSGTSGYHNNDNAGGQDTIFGVTYTAGHRFIGDSNTRNLNWGQGGSDQIPHEVKVIEYSYDSCDAIRESYNTFDSADSV